MKINIKYCAIFFSVVIALALTIPSPAQESECTTALISGRASPDGRPLLWKSRDVSNWHQEFQYYERAPYSFIGLNYPFVANENECYGGINEVGFAIENSNALNFPDSATAYDDDGIIMHHALQTCETVDDFLAYMDSTARVGRTRPSCYGVFDAYGNGGILEASKYSNYWFDVNDTVACPEGFLVRSNFAYMGGTSHVGQYRHDRAYDIIEPAVLAGTIDARLLFDDVARDVSNETVNPYPLPYNGFYVYLGDTLEGAVRTHNAINREITMSCFVAVGIQPGEDPLLSYLWAQVGEPALSPTLPLWMGSFSVPYELTGQDPDSPMNLRLNEIFEWIYYPYVDPYDDIIDTYKLDDGQGNGVIVRLREIEDMYYWYVLDLTEDWRLSTPSPAVISAVQDSLSEMVMDILTSPAAPVLTVQVSPAQLNLNWPAVSTSWIGDPMTVDGYTIYRALSPYSAIYDSIGFTDGTTYTIPAGSMGTQGFYKVKARD